MKYLYIIALLFLAWVTLDMAFGTPAHWVLG